MGGISSVTRSCPGPPSPTLCATGTISTCHRARRWPSALSEPLVALANQAVVVEAVKAADDRSGDVVVRCYESLGGKATTTLKTSFPLRRAAVTDLLERQLSELQIEPGNQLTLDLRPFQVLTLRLSPEK